MSTPTQDPATVNAWELVDDADAPEDMSGVSPAAAAKLVMLRSLRPGKTAVRTVESRGQRGEKAAITRIARRYGLSVTVWSAGHSVCVRLDTQEVTQ